MYANVRFTVTGRGNDPEPDHRDVINALGVVASKFSMEQEDLTTYFFAELSKEEFELVYLTYLMDEDECYYSPDSAEELDWHWVLNYVPDVDILAWFGWRGWHLIEIDFWTEDERWHEVFEKAEEEYLRS